MRALMQKWQCFIVMLVMVCSTVACTDYNIDVPEVSHQSLIMLDVGNIEIIPYQGRDSAVLPLPASVMAKEWFDRRLKISGKNEKRFVVEIVQAETMRNPKATSYKFDAYTTEIKVSYKLYEPTQNLPRMSAEAVLKMTREVKKDASAPDRDKFFATINRQLLERMDTEFPTHIEKYFSEHILMMR